MAEDSKFGVSFLTALHLLQININCKAENTDSSDQIQQFSASYEGGLYGLASRPAKFLRIDSTSPEIQHPVPSEGSSSFYIYPNTFISLVAASRAAASFASDLPDESNSFEQALSANLLNDGLNTDAKSVAGQAFSALEVSQNHLWITFAALLLRRNRDLLRIVQEWAQIALL